MFMLFAIYADKQALDVLASMGYGTARGLDEGLIIMLLLTQFPEEEG